MLTKTEKGQVVASLGDKLDRATSVFVADYRGLAVKDMTELRTQLRGLGEDEAEFQVAKNSLLRLAIEGRQAKPISEYLNGPVALAISYGDSVGLAKILVDYSKKHEVFDLRGGLMDGVSLDSKQIAHLATLPNLQQLRGKIVGVLQAPAQKLARILNEPAGQLARIVAAREDVLSQ